MHILEYVRHEPTAVLRVVDRVAVTVRNKVFNAVGERKTSSERRVVVGEPEVVVGVGSVRVVFGKGGDVVIVDA